MRLQLVSITAIWCALLHRVRANEKAEEGNGCSKATSLDVHRTGEACGSTEIGSIKTDATYYTLADVQERNGENGADFWAVVESYVLDLTAFLQQHPAGARKIIQKKKELGPDITPNFIDHFGHTVRAFREACKQYDQQLTPVVLRFRETPDPSAKVVILGKVRN